MTAPSVLLIAPFDDGEFAHSNQRARALERIGCDVTSFDLRRRSGFLGFLGGSDLRSRILKAIETAEADAVIVIGGYDLSENMVEGIRREVGKPMVNWFPDDLGRLDDILVSGRAYDHVFVIGSDVAAGYQRAVGSSVEILPHAADPSIYRPVRTKDQYRANVVFAGGATPVRERYLAELVECGLALWGPGWRRTALRDYCRGEARTTAEYVRAYGGASVAVNLHHDVGSRDATACNQRVFELAAMGLPQVVDARVDLPHYLEPEREVVTFSSPKELKERVKELLQS
ncbi:MAG: CgeB family protein, partial [Gemmatimonadales bacterium]